MADLMTHHPKMYISKHLITLSLPLICLVICYCAPTVIEKDVPIVKEFVHIKPPKFSLLPTSSNPKYAAANLIAIREVDPSIIIHLQYKHPTRVAKSPLYTKNFPALLRPETALRLSHANAIVKKYGLRIKVWDAYRPPSAQIKLFNASGRDARYVANPASAPSQHSCGTAVDITLVKLNGSSIPMPTGFDSFTPQASSSYNHSDPVIAKNLKILQYAMHSSGFHHLPREWWHYIDINYKNYPETIPMSAIE